VEFLLGTTKQRNRSFQGIDSLESMSCENLCQSESALDASLRGNSGTDGIYKQYRDHLAGAVDTHQHAVLTVPQIQVN
jgi:hypothetical protein